MTTVAVPGGGVAGLSTAHELAERGFEVTVYEQRREPPAFRELRPTGPLACALRRVSAS
jgi:2-polyprenyl-6-methoxyphenol hydroxylase-like FAD-dependent oxidoreductase